MSWEKNHARAMMYPTGVEAPHVLMYRAINAMDVCEWHEDGFAHEPLIELVRAARKLLNMEAGRLDCATLDRFYVRVLKDCGVEE